MKSNSSQGRALGAFDFTLLVIGAVIGADIVCRRRRGCVAAGAGPAGRVVDCGRPGGDHRADVRAVLGYRAGCGRVIRVCTRGLWSTDWLCLGLGALRGRVHCAAGVSAGLRQLSPGGDRSVTGCGGRRAQGGVNRCRHRDEPGGSATGRPPERRAFGGEATAAGGAYRGGHGLPRVSLSGGEGQPHALRASRLGQPGQGRAADLLGLRRLRAGGAAGRRGAQPRYDPAARSHAGHGHRLGFLFADRSRPGDRPAIGHRGGLTELAGWTR